VLALEPVPSLGVENWKSRGVASLEVKFPFVVGSSAAGAGLDAPPKPLGFSNRAGLRDLFEVEAPFAPGGPFIYGLGVGRPIMMSIKVVVRFDMISIIVVARSQFIRDHILLLFFGESSLRYLLLPRAVKGKGAKRFGLYHVCSSARP
jgi:hypothetical protein